MRVPKIHLLDKKKIGFKNIDRSFTDLGYIGYNEGIHLHFLDTEANW